MTHMSFHVQLLKCFTIMEGTMWHEVKQNNFAHGTLGHAIEHGQVKGSHITLNVQHESSFKFTLRGHHLSWEHNIGLSPG